MNNVTITINDKKYKYQYNTTLLEISKNFTDLFENDIILGEVNGKPMELSYRITYDCKISFHDYTSPIGSIVYQNGLIFLLEYAFKHLINGDIMVNHSIDKGILITTNKVISKKDLENITEEMKKLQKDDIPIEKKLINRMEAIKYYKKLKAFDKVNILKYTTNTNINLYKIGDIYDFFFSYLPINTKILSKFKLEYISKNSFVLCYPNIYHENKIKKYKHHKKIYDEFEKYSSWSKIIGVKNIADINKKISDSDFEDIILLSENYQNNNLYKIASTIAKNKQIKIVLMSGPSSSGKTTSSRKLKLFLKSFGLKPLSISLDDYYLDRNETPKKADGTYDYESINAIDIKLFNSHMTQLLDKKEVKLPTYNFILGKKEYNEKGITLAENEILIIEGLHALNNKIIEQIDKSRKFKIYLSPLTVLNIDNHNRIRTTDNRLLRRIVRDNRTRGYSASKTLASWQDVREGEEVNVFNFQDEADVIFNTSLAYELNVLKTYVEPLLYSVEETDDNYSEAVRLLNLLNNVLPIPSELIPSDSIIREFIGNSYFNKEE